MPVVQRTFIARRTLSAAESHVAWERINQHILVKRDELTRSLGGLAQRIGMLAGFGIDPKPVVRELGDMLALLLEDTYEFGRREAKRELGELRASRATPPELFQIGARKVDEPAEHAAAIRRRAQEAAEALEEDVEVYLQSNAGDAVGAARTAQTGIRDAVLAMVGNSLNLGRTRGATEAEGGPPRYAMRSEQLDKNTCGPCEQYHGTLVVIGSPEYYELLPPAFCLGMGRCRGVMVYGDSTSELTPPDPGPGELPDPFSTTSPFAGATPQRLADADLSASEFSGRLEVWRVGKTTDQGRGVFFGESEESIRDYAALHEGEQAKRYVLQVQRARVYEHQYEAAKDLLGKPLNDIIDSIEKRKGITRTQAFREAEARIAAKLRAKGYDGVIYRTPPAPAKRELAIISKKPIRNLADEFEGPSPFELPELPDDIKAEIKSAGNRISGLKTNLKKPGLDAVKKAELETRLKIEYDLRTFLKAKLAGTASGSSADFLKAQIASANNRMSGLKTRIKKAGNDQAKLAELESRLAYQQKLRATLQTKLEELGPGGKVKPPGVTPPVPPKVPEPPKLVTPPQPPPLAPPPTPPAPKPPTSQLKKPVAGAKRVESTNVAGYTHKGGWEKTIRGVKVFVEDGADPSIWTYYDGLLKQTPLKFREKIRRVNHMQGRSPMDAQFAQQYGKPGFTAAATADSAGRISYWRAGNVDDFFPEQAWHHELGHVIGQNNGPLVPSEWASAASYDAKLAPKRQADYIVSPTAPAAVQQRVRLELEQSITNYGALNEREDWAEFFSMAMLEKKYGPLFRTKATHSPVSLAQLYPARAKLIKQWTGISTPKKGAALKAPPPPKVPKVKKVKGAVVRDMGAFQKFRTGQWHGYQPGEVESLRHYQGSGYREISDYLRRGNEYRGVRDYVRHIDLAMKRYATDEPVLVYRGMRRFLRKLGVTSWDKAVGRSFVDRCYASTSTRHQVAEGFSGASSDSAVVHITMPKGTRGAWLGEGGATRGRAYSSEQEFLLDRDYAWTVTSVQRNPRGYYDVFVTLSTKKH